MNPPPSLCRFPALKDVSSAGVEEVIDGEGLRGGAG